MNWKQVFIGAAAASLLAACSSTKPPETASTSQPASNVVAPATDSSAVQNQTALDPLRDPNGALAQRSVFFDFDSSVVKDEYKGLIGAHADFLKANGNHKITIQGNTDARGSREYNLALGQRRAESVKHSMQVLGVPEKQLEAVSFGKEKPKATGNNDEDYAQNRRDDIVYDGQ